MSIWRMMALAASAGPIRASLPLNVDCSLPCPCCIILGACVDLMKHKITLIPGDGIGPEVTGAAISVLRAAGFQAEWEPFVVGAEALTKYGDPLPRDLIDSIRRNKVALKGPVITPVGTGFVSSNVRLRKELDLFANLRPVKSLAGVKSRYENVDLIVVRENTEDLYSGLEHEVVPGVVESLKIITDRASRRIARFACEHARQEGRKKITAIHKANIMKLSDGLFLRCFREVASEYPEIEANDLIVDNACMQLVIDPTQFDVLLLENLYGDIVSDLGAGFRIAALDLELRGAGNMLGGEQSGHMDALGFDLYTQMLERTVAELRGEQVEDEPTVSINLGVDVAIPESYIADMGQRLRTYKRVSSARDEEALAAIGTETEDRYGRIPEPVAGLFGYARLRQAAEAVGVISIDRTKDGIAIKLAEKARVAPEKLFELISVREGATFAPSGVLRLELDEEEKDQMLAVARRVLLQIISDS